MSKSDSLSPTMQEALALVPNDWEKLPYPSVQLGGRSVRSVLFDKTFCALRDRSLIEFKGGPGSWRWRRVDPDRDLVAEADRDTRESISALAAEREEQERRIDTAMKRIAAINGEIAALEGKIQPRSAA